MYVSFDAFAAADGRNSELGVGFAAHGAGSGCAAPEFA